MKDYMKRLISVLLVIAMTTTSTFTVFAEAGGSVQKSAGDVFSLEKEDTKKEITWAQAGRQIAGMLSYIVEDAANIDLTVHSERIKDLSLEDDSIYLAILAEEGYLPEEPEKIDPEAVITEEEYLSLLETAFPTVLDSQTAIDTLQGEMDPGNLVLMGDDLSISTLLPERVAVAEAQQLSMTAVKSDALSLNAVSSVELSECEIERVHISDTAVDEEESDSEEEADSDKEADSEEADSKEKADSEETDSNNEETDSDKETDPDEEEPDLIYLHMNSGTQLPEIIVKSADEVIIEGSGALGVVRVQEAVNALTVRATGSVVNETEEAFEVTGPDDKVVELQPGEQVDFVLNKWLVSFVTEGTPVKTQEVAPGGMVNYAGANTELEGKIFTAWYEDADFSTPASRLETVDRDMTLYARFVDEADAAVVTFETFGGSELEPLVFAKGEYLLTKPVQSLYTAKEGYTFGGWCVDEECTTGFGYMDPIEESMTLYALYSSEEQIASEKPGTVAEVELPDGEAAIGLVLPEGMTADEVLDNITLEEGTGPEAPEITVRETEGGAEIYCEEGFVPGTTFTLTAQNGVMFEGQPEYIDTLTVSIYREQIEVVEFAEGLTYVLWDDVTDYTPVSRTNDTEDMEDFDNEDMSDYTGESTVFNMLEENEAKGEVIPGRLILTGDADLRPEQVVVFYDGEINRDEISITEWESGDRAGYVLYAQIMTVEPLEDGTSEVTFRYADPEDYISELEIHTTEGVDLEEQLTEEQIAQAEKTIVSQISSNEELKAQMMMAVMTSDETQKILDDKYGPGTYSLAGTIVDPTSIDVDPNITTEDSTLTVSVDVTYTMVLYDTTYDILGAQGKLATITPKMHFEQQLTLDVNADGGFLWMDMSVVFKTKTDMNLELEVVTGEGTNVIDKAKTTLEEVIQADGTAVDGYDYEKAAYDLMGCMLCLTSTEHAYFDLFAVPLLNIKKNFYYGLETIGFKIELIGQASVTANFGVKITAEYGQKVGFKYNFLKSKGGTYKQKLAGDVTSEVFLIGAMGVRLGIQVTLYFKIAQVIQAHFFGAVFVYVELAGMFMHKAAVSAGGGNYADALHLDVGIDLELGCKTRIDLFLFAFELSSPLWTERWSLYTLDHYMTMSVVEKAPLEEMWAKTMKNANYKTSYNLLYLPLDSYDLRTAKCTKSQLLFENLQEGNVTAKLSLENVVINGEPVAADDPRVNVMVVGDGTDGHRYGSIYADEYAAANYKVEDYQCDVVLTYKNKNKSELIKNHRQVFPFHREFKMAITTVDVNIALYDWCAHSWGIEAAQWDNTTVYETTFEDTHILGCPTDISATGEIDLDEVIATVRKQYPEIDESMLSWFNPTLNQVNRTVQYSIPQFSNLCYLTPNSGTVRYNVYETTNEYSVTFCLFVNRYQGYTGDITYIIEADDAPADTLFTIRGRDTGENRTFVRMEDTSNRWSLTVPRVAFNGSRRPIQMRVNGGETIDSGLTVTGREKESVVVLKLESLKKKLSVTGGKGIASWEIRSHDPSQMNSILAGEKVVLSAGLMNGYQNLRLTSEPAGLQYLSDGSTVTFTMPAHDVSVTLYGSRNYQVNFMYNYDGLGVYRSADVEEGSAVGRPSDPSVSGLTFAGWYDNAECRGEPFDFAKPITGNITLYADWRVNVTVDLGGPKGKAEANGYGLIFPGDQSEYARYTYSTHKVGDTALDYKLPSYMGYDFLGWYTNPEFSGEPVNPATYVLTGGVTFYACWKAYAFLTYELNYGEQETPYYMSMEYVGMPVQHMPEKPQRENYRFLGWFRSSKTTADNYVRLDDYIVEKSITLYAGWKPQEYIITYNLDGGENNPANPGYYTIESKDIVIGEPTRKGYQFLGWTAKGIGTDDGTVRIPAGSTGNITLTANWEVSVYTLSCDAAGGTMTQTVPDTYTVKSEAIALENPTRTGYTFLGWTGTNLTEPTTDVVIPKGSTGNRSYRANWRANTSIDDIVAKALAAIPDSHTMSVNDFSGIEVIQTLAMDALTGDDTFAPYLDQISVTVEQVGEAVEKSASISYTVKATVTFTDDDGNISAKSKNVALKVEKNPVTITADVRYPSGRKSVPYGTRLADVELNGKATSDGETVKGSFTWEDDTIVPLSADNGSEIYKVVFTPEDPGRYSTAETMIAVNARTGVKVVLDAPDTIEYTGRALDLSECSFHAVDMDTGEKITGAAFSITGAVLEQPVTTPGRATVTLKGYETLEITGVSDPDLYDIDDTDISDTITITRAVPVISGVTEYTADYGSVLRSIVPDLKAATAAEDTVAGTFAWENPNIPLKEAGEYTYKVIFTPDDLSCYSSAVIDAKVTVSGYPGEVTYIIEAPDAPSDALFTVTADHGGEKTLSFAPVEGEQNRWRLDVARAAFDGTEHAIMLQMGENDPVRCGLTITGREAESEVILKLDYVPRKLSVSAMDGIGTWEMLTPAGGQADAIAPGEKVVLSVSLKDGYNELRSTSDPAGLNASYENGRFSFTMPAQDVELVLRGVKDYQAEFLYNYDDMGVYRTIDTQEDGGISMPKDPSVEGLTFAGWYDNAGCTGEAFDFTKKLSGNITLYADWRVNVTVDFGVMKGKAAYDTSSGEEGSGGGGSSSFELIFPGDETEYERFTYSTQKVGDHALEIVLPESAEYRFFGWYLTPDFSGEGMMNLSSFELTGGVTFYACWKKAATLTYRKNDGVDEAPFHEALEYVGMKMQNAPGEVPQRDGYKFTGWYRTPACEEADRIDPDTYLVEGTMTLYAGWEPEVYSISYELNGGENNASNPDSYTVESKETAIGRPERKGYQFLGWTGTGLAEPTPDVVIPAGSTGDITLTAEWEPIVYSISYELNGGENNASNPDSYTVESGETAIGRPERKGYQFLGWMGTDLTEPTLEVKIPAGSTGNRSYTAKWKADDPIASIVDAALEAIPDSHEMSINDFTGTDVIRKIAWNAVEEDENCADYLTHLSVESVPYGEAEEDGEGYSYTATVTVTYQDEENTFSNGKDFLLRVLKNPVTIKAEAGYPADSSYIPYGTSLGDVTLTGTASSGGTEVKGSFAWADDTIVPLSTDNGNEIYKVVFTPEDSGTYSTAETQIAVNTQIGLKIVLDAPDTIEYMGRAVDASECRFYASDIATGKMIKGATLDITGAVLEQSMITPGSAPVKLKSYETCEISGVSDTSLYAIAGTDASDIITITRAKTVLSGSKKYNADYGRLLSSITPADLGLKAATSAEDTVAGTFAWEAPSTLPGVGTSTYRITFTPDDLNCYSSAFMDVEVTVEGVPGKITYFIEAPDAPDGTGFTVAAENGPVKTMNFAPVEGETNRWSLTTDRAAFDGTTHAIMLNRTGIDSIESGLTLTGREEESEVTLRLEHIPRKLTVNSDASIESWKIQYPDASMMNAIAPGAEVKLSAILLEGYNNLRLTSDAADLNYDITKNTDDITENTVTFIMPAQDVSIDLRGVKINQVNFRYNYGDMGIYRIADIAEDGSITMPEDPVVEGLIFKGWYNNKEFEGKPYKGSETFSGNTDLYADWWVTVTVDFGGQKGKAQYYGIVGGGSGDGLESAPVLIIPGDDSEKERFTFEMRVDQRMVELVKPDIEGFDFGGWYRTDDYTGEVHKESSEYWLDESMTFYARWLKKAKIDYWLNYQEEESADLHWTATEYVGELIKKKVPPDPERPDYEFTDWYRRTDCQEEDKIDFATYLVEGDMNLYAGWKPIDYKITYNLEGGTNDPGNPASYTIEDDRIDIAQPTREGYKFRGWEGTGLKEPTLNVVIPTGSSGVITLKAIWDPVAYTLFKEGFKLHHGEAVNPLTYTIESDDITLDNPSAEGYNFLGWVDGDSDEPVLEVVIPKGSTGNHEYWDVWETTVPVSEIIQTLLGAIPAASTISVKDLSKPDDIEKCVMNALKADQTCERYLDNYYYSDDALDIVVLPTGDAVQDGEDFVYKATVTVSFTDDNYIETKRSKNITMRAAKNNVTIDVSAVYEKGEKYIPYGTPLGKVELTGTAKDEAGNTVDGTFQWADPDIIPRGANNGELLYEVVFTPNDTSSYNTAQTAIAVSAQIGVQPVFNLGDEVPYYGRDLDYFLLYKDLDGFYMADFDTGDRLPTNLGITNPYYVQTSYMPGPATISLTKDKSHELTRRPTITDDEPGIIYYDPYLDLDKYFLVSADASATFKIVPSDTEFTHPRGLIPVTVEGGTKLGDIDYMTLLKGSYYHWSLFDIDACGETYKWAIENDGDLTGTLVWENPDTVLDKVGTFEYNIVFQPDRTDLFNPCKASVEITVTSGKVAIPVIEPAEYNGTLQKANISDTAYYTVESNSGGIDASDYTVVLKLKDSVNTAWSDGTTADKVLTFTIKPAKLKLDKTKHSVSPLSYGQQLCTDPNGTSNDIIKTANDMLSGLVVTGINGEQINGKWVWDASMEGITLCASIKGDNADFGDGHSVEAYYLPYVDKPENYSQLRETFTVQVSRSTPDTNNCGGYIAEENVYQPEPPAEPVNTFGNFEPRIKRMPVNDKTGESVPGWMEWPDPDKFVENTAVYNAVFHPYTETINGVVGSNYKDADVKINMPVTNQRRANIIMRSGNYLYWMGNLTSRARKVIRDNKYGTAETEVWMSLDGGELGMLHVSRIQVYRHGTDILLSDNEYKADGSHIVSGANRFEVYLEVESNESGNAVCTIKYGSGQTKWTLSDLDVYMELADQNNTTVTNASSFSLRSRAAAAVPTVEPTPVPEPGAIGNVVRIEPKQDAKKTDDLWTIQLAKDQKKVEFKWDVSKTASEYLVYTQKQDGKAEPELIDMTKEKKIELDAADYASGRYKLYVGAVLEDGSVSWGEALFELMAYVEPTAEPTLTPTAEPTPVFTAEPTPEPTAEPTPEPTAEPTPAPTAEPTQVPTAEPTQVPTVEPTPEPTAEPIVEPTAEPEPMSEPAPEPGQEAPAAEAAAGELPE
ncbi:MAG: InlB B-repeat-containing protein [Blautia sp.]|nr:InlB B-repeat-containing protein [Blautia sp.]